MAKIPGLNITAPVVPSQDTDTYPSHRAIYGHGGWREVTTLAERDAIPALRRESGMSVYVTDLQKLYILQNDLTTWTEFASGSGGGIDVDGTTIINQNNTATAVGVKTKSDDIMYDWMGTLAEWEAGRLAGTIPDNWICWITDDEDEPAGIANLAQVASTGLLEDLNDVPSLPQDKLTKNYLLVWNHLNQCFTWVETDIQPPEGEYDPNTYTLTIFDADWDDGILITDYIIPIDDQGEYDPSTETLTISEAEYDNNMLTTSSIIPIDGQDEEYDPIDHMLAIENIVYEDNTVITNQIQPMENT